MISKGTDLYTIESDFYSFKKRLLTTGCIFNQDMCDKAYNEGVKWVEKYSGNRINEIYASSLVQGLWKFIDGMYKLNNK